jgi:hypothetical protein
VPSFNLIGRASGAIQPWLGGIGGVGGLRLLAMDALSTDSGARNRNRRLGMWRPGLCARRLALHQVPPSRSRASVAMQQYPGGSPEELVAGAQMDAEAEEK